MENYLEFNGLKHYPLGQAKLEIIEENLIVSNISAVCEKNISQTVFKYSIIY